jgi:8-amino-3,8-dideoxy-alpha-D-manno-octulosonate transaminase
MAGMDLYGAEERKQVQEVLETGCFFRYNHEHLRADRWKARELEAEVAQFTGAPFVHAVSSGSTAVQTALAAAGIGFGDHVIVPPFTYIATIEAVLWAGALPVFAEIDENLCLSVEGIRAALTPQTKAVLLVHMCGAAADMDGITALCKQHNLTLVEDAGQAFGAFYKGKHVGLFGKAGAVSMDFFKIITAGEGGLCLANDEETYNHMQQLSDHGHDHIGNNRGMEQHPIIGTNFRLSELHAAVGLAQARKVNSIRNNNRAAKAAIRAELAQVKGVSFRPMPDPDGDSATFLNFFLPDQPTAHRAWKQLAADGLAGFNYWYINMYHFINQWDHIKNLTSPFKMAIHHLGAPQDYHNLHLPKSQEVIGRLISLGIKASWSVEEASAFGAQVAQSIRKTISETAAV